jgi:hypothetical protein
LAGRRLGKRNFTTTLIKRGKSLDAPAEANYSRIAVDEGP